MSDLPELPDGDAVELASRYLDGDLSPDERAGAAANPEVMAWVDRFVGIQAALREPLQVDAGRRDAAIVAAAAALDDGLAVGDGSERTGADVAPPPGVDDLAVARSRRAGRMTRWLGAAAAAVAVAIGGVALIGNSDGDDSADEAPFQARTEMSAASDTDSGNALTYASEAPDAPMAATETAGDSADAEATPDSTVASEHATNDGPTSGAGSASETTATATTAAAAPSASTTAPGAATTGAPPASTTAAGEQRLDGPNDLQQFATAQVLTVPAGSEAPCADQSGGDLVAIDVHYADQPAVVYRDDQQHTISAYSADTCALLDAVDYTTE